MVTSGFGWAGFIVAEIGTDAPQKEGRHAHKPEITAFCNTRLQQLICVIDFDRDCFGGVAGHPKWDVPI